MTSTGTLTEPWLSGPLFSRSHFQHQHRHGRGGPRSPLRREREREGGAHTPLTASGYLLPTPAPKLRRRTEWETNAGVPNTHKALELKITWHVLHSPT